MTMHQLQVYSRVTLNSLQIPKDKLLKSAAFFVLLYNRDTNYFIPKITGWKRLVWQLTAQTL